MKRREFNAKSLCRKRRYNSSFGEMRKVTFSRTGEYDFSRNEKALGAFESKARNFSGLFNCATHNRI